MLCVLPAFALMGAGSSAQIYKPVHFQGQVALMGSPLREELYALETLPNGVRSLIQVSATGSKRVLWTGRSPQRLLGTDSEGLPILAQEEEARRISADGNSIELPPYLRSINEVCLGFRVTKTQVALDAFSMTLRRSAPFSVYTPIGTRIAHANDGYDIAPGRQRLLSFFFNRGGYVRGNGPDPGPRIVVQAYALEALTGDACDYKEAAAFPISKGFTPVVIAALDNFRLLVGCVESKPLRTQAPVRDGEFTLGPDVKYSFVIYVADITAKALVEHARMAMPIRDSYVDVVALKDGRAALFSGGHTVYLARGL
jgi:hypothetical protein